MRRRISTRTLIENGAVIGVVVLVAFVLVNVISFATSRGRLPPETRLAGVDVSGLTPEEAISRTVEALQAPVALSYMGRPIELLPDAIEFRLNDAIARLQLDELIGQQQGLDKLPAFMLRQYASPAQLDAPYQYSEPKLQTALGEIALKNDREARPPTLDLNASTVTPGQDGTSLDLSEAAQRVLAAMASSVSRTVDLPVDVIPLGDASVKSLEPALTERLKAFTDVPGNVAGLFIKDLRTGEELSINADVAFSGRGWLKLAVMLEAVRAAASPLSDTLRAQLSQMSSQGSDSAANDVLRQLGNGDPASGVDRVNALAHALGLRNTFVAQPFDLAATAPTIVTPGNSRGDINALPDPTAQTTVAEVGVLLEMIELCRNGQGALALALGESITPEKCGDVLAALGENRATPLIHVSEGATALQRQSWDATNHGAAGLVRSPGGSYVIAVMLHGNAALSWADTAPIIGDISRLTYGFFNGVLPPDVPPLAGPPSP
jgi:hypothetical protein